MKGFGLPLCVDVLANGVFEFGRASMCPAPQLLAGQVGEEALDLIDPRGAGGSEFCESRSCPGRDGRRELRGPWYRSYEELAELDASVPSVMLGDDLARLDIEGCKQRGGALTNVVVGAALDLSGPHGRDG